MKKIKLILAFTLLVNTFFACNKEEKKSVETTATTAPAVKHKIVSLNGAVTEIIAALGHEKEIVAVDVTSTYPETIKSTAKDLGHVRSISVESVMALQPTLIMGTSKDISPELLEKLKASGVKAIMFEQEFSAQGTKKLIADVALALDNKSYKDLQDKIDADLNKVQHINNAPKVLFIYARGAGTLMVAGKNTPVEKVISLAGGKNAITDFEDFKALTPEALIKGNPDVILMFDSGLQSLGGAEGVLKIQGVDKTNAGKNKKIISMDGGLLSGFGPRVGEAATILNSLLIENAK